jgi:hypothetical protein
MQPEHNPQGRTRSSRERLAARLGLALDPRSQDWEWQVADPTRFPEWLATYRDAPLDDGERVSLMEMLVQCVDDLARLCDSPAQVERLPEWVAVAGLLRANPRLHAATIAYWCVLGAEDPEEQFAVSPPMRQVWAEVAPAALNNGGRPT